MCRRGRMIFRCCTVVAHFARRVWRHTAAVIGAADVRRTEEDGEAPSAATTEDVVGDAARPICQYLSEQDVDSGDIYVGGLAMIGAIHFIRAGL